MNTKLKKYIGFGILILAILLISYFIFKPSKEKYFDKIYIPKTSMVMNHTHDNYIDTIVHAGLNILDIDTVFVQLRILEDINLPNGDYDFGAAIITGGKGQFIIFLKKDDTRDENINKISHELIHLRDYHNGTLILFDEYGAIYNNNEWEDLRKIEYVDRPWEIVAFKEGPKLAKDIKEKLYTDQ